MKVLPVTLHLIVLGDRDIVHQIGARLIMADR